MKNTEKKQTLNNPQNAWLLMHDFYNHILPQDTLTCNDDDDLKRNIPLIA